MRMPTVEELYAIARDHQLDIIEASFSYEVGNGIVNISETQEQSLEKFIQLIKSLNKQFFFLDVKRLDHEEIQDIYCIDLDEITREEYGDACEKIRRKAKKYNEKLLAVPIDQPAALRLFVIADGISYRLCFLADWYDSLLSEDSDDVLERITEEFLDEIANLQQQKAHALSQLRTEIEIELAEEPMFQKCTNKKARFTFAANFIPQKDYPLTSRSEIEDIAEMAWARFKSSK